MKLKFELDHIGIATESLEQGRGFYEALGLGPLTTERVDSEKVTVGFFDLANDARLELLEPTGPDSPVAGFLAKRGPGIHHICLRVSDIRAAVQTLKAHGVRLINEEPRRGAHDCLVVFIHPKSTGGLLIELSQPAEARG
jgi:methylmalonyl-CoA/ethylmalonyl-CoA epimerase